VAGWRIVLRKKQLGTIRFIPGEVKEKTESDLVKIYEIYTTSS
jgi:hypothetical protein